MVLYTKFPAVDAGSVVSAKRREAKKISEHQRYLRHHRLTDSMVIHAEEEGHLPNWEAAETVKIGLSKSQRKNSNQH